MSKTHAVGVDFLTTRDVADVSGLSVGSVRVMVARSKARRDTKRSRTTDIPVADFMVYRNPLWSRETIAAWMQRREDAGLSTPTKRTSPSAKKAVAAAAIPAKAKR